MAYRILMVEDDFALAMGTEYALQSDGYEVVRAGTIETARKLYDNNIDLILLDVMLPDGTGFSFCEEIRSKGSHVPVIFLSAVSEEANIVQGLELGADDYVTKPYRVKELLSRILANIRRSSYREGRSQNVYSFGSHEFHVDEFALFKGGKTVECTTSELKLLRILLMNAGNVLERRTMLEKLYDIDGEFIDDNTLSVYMKRLRDRLGEDSSYIETVRGVGYRFKKL
ncbi:MAG: response regulator transcription factor [Clostridium sp.]|nr:response regulator transcription factor [Clostridium sp.]MCM1399804.1 response regulator transcription factor [Clostridium sp.]MCM1459569.1 response regulator transcription factor [Bacteroides sp.]